MANSSHLFFLFFHFLPYSAREVLAFWRGEFGKEKSDHKLNSLRWLELDVDTISHIPVNSFLRFLCLFNCEISTKCASRALSFGPGSCFWGWHDSARQTKRWWRRRRGQGWVLWVQVQVRVRFGSRGRGRGRCRGSRGLVSNSRAAFVSFCDNFDMCDIVFSFFLLFVFVFFVTFFFVVAVSAWVLPADIFV